MLKRSPSPRTNLTTLGMEVGNRRQILNRSVAALVSVFAAGTLSLQAATFTWTGANDNLWNTGQGGGPGATNWLSTPLPDRTPLDSSFDLPFAGDLIFTSAAPSGTTITNDVPGTFIHSITFDAGSPAFTLNGGSIVFDGGGSITNNSANAQTLSFTNEVAAPFSGISLTNFSGISTQSFDAAAGDIIITNVVSFDAPVTLTVTGAFNTTISGAIIDNQMPNQGVLVKNGSGTLTLSGTNTYGGPTTINAGTLRTQNASALGTGSVTLNSAILAANGTLNVGSLTWNSGRIQLAPAAGDIVNVATTFTNGGGGGTYRLDATGLTPGTFTLTTFGTTNFLQQNFSAEFFNVPANVVFQTQFLLNPNDVQLIVLGATATGPLLQNSAPVNIPTFADFIVNGPVSTGTPSESNTIKTLTFLPGSSLDIYNTLTVTQGPVNLVASSSIRLINATLSVSQLNVLPGALLHGNGTIAGNLSNAGTVSPGGTSIGTIGVTGAYTQAPTGILRIDIGGRNPGQYDQLSVGGPAQLGGTLELVRLNNFDLRRGDKIIFLTAQGGVSGEFATVINPFTSKTILIPTIVYGDNTVSLEMIRGSFEKLSNKFRFTPNQRSVSKALDRLSARDVDNKALVYLDQRELNKLPADFDKISPDQLTSIFRIGTSLATVQSINLQRRTDDLRNGASGFSAGGLAMQGTGPGYSGAFRTGAAGPTGEAIRDGKSMKESKDVMLPPDTRWGAFLTGVGEWVDVSGDGNARGYDITTGGFTLGVDYKLTPNLAIGVMAGYAGTAVDLINNGRIWVNGGKLGLYATTFAGGWYADLAVNGGYNSYDTKRSALQGTARGSTNGGEFNALIGTGYDWKIGGLQIGPTATFNYTNIGFDGYTEKGSLAPLNIAGRNAESIRSALGFKASYDWRVGGVIIKPELRAAWQHEFGDSSYEIASSFANGGGGNNFLVSGPEIGRDSLLLGAGVAVLWNERTSTYVYYDGELGRERYDAHNVSGGVRVAF